MPRPFWLLLLALAACDSGGSEDDLIVGTWRPTLSELKTVVTVTQAQPLIDPSEPTTGEILVTGDDPATFRTLGEGLRYPDETILRFGTQEPDRSASLLLTDATDRDPLGPRASAYTLSLPGVTVIYRTQTLPFPFELDGATLRIPLTTLQSDTGRFTEIAGELTFASTPLQPGEEVVIAEESYGKGERGERYVFERGGRARIEVPNYSDGLDVRTGRWSTNDDKLRLQVEGNRLYDDLDAVYTFRVSGGTLSLTPVPTPCDEEYQRTAAARALLVPGSVDHCRVETVLSFQSAAQAE